MFLDTIIFINMLLVMLYSKHFTTLWHIIYLESCFEIHSKLVENQSNLSP